jgi:hypothetical protein
MRKIISLTVAAVLVLGFLPAARASLSFADISGHWSEGYMTKMIAAGVVVGDGKGFAMPDKGIERYEAAIMLARAFGLGSLDLPDAVVGNYSDINAGSMFVAEYINNIIAAGFMTGSGGRFEPQREILRQEAFTALQNAFRFQEAPGSFVSSFPDFNDVPDWARESVLAMEAAGMLNGKNGKIAPSETITRAEFAALLSRAAGIFIDADTDFENAEADRAFIRKPGLKAENLTAERLTVAQGVGDGGVYLGGCDIGVLHVFGGGDGTVRLIGTSVTELIVGTSLAGGVRIYIGEDSIVETVIIYSEDAELDIKGEVIRILDRTDGGERSLTDAGTPDEAEGFAPVTGMEMMKKLGMGINIGNTFDAVGNWFSNHMDAETAWGEARVERRHLSAIKNKGFDNVRIPVSWGLHMNNDRKISGEWMDRVAQVVDWALDEGLIVTINTHHDGELYDLMYRGTYEQALKWLTDVWAQIAERFKDYDERLIFEPMNEPRPGDGGWYWDYNIFAAQIPVLAERTNRLNHGILEFIRGTGGNNGKRVVALTTVQADPNLLYLYQHPHNDPYTMVGVFFYSTGVHIQNSLSQIKTALDKNIPVVIKETAPLDDSLASDTQRLDWSRNIYAELAKLGVPSQWWNHEEKTGWALFSRAANVWNTPLVDVFFAAYGKTPR